MRSHGRSRNISYPVPRVVQRDNHWPRRTPAKRARAVAGSGDASTLYKLTTQRPNHETSSKRECRKLVTISTNQCSRTTKQKPNTKATSSTKTHFNPTMGLKIPFCVGKRNNKNPILQHKYDWKSTADGRRTLEECSISAGRKGPSSCEGDPGLGLGDGISTGRKAPSSYEGDPGFGLGDGPGRWSVMHALALPVQKHKLPRPEGSPER